MTRNEISHIIENEYRPFETESLPVYGPLHDMELSEWQEAQRLASIRHELSEIEQDANALIRVASLAQKGSDLPPVLIESEPSVPETPSGAVQERQMKRKAKEVKEKSPKRYSEMLIAVNDFQLLRNADDEAVGAFMRYLEANRGKITHLVLNGDIVDMEQANKFGSSPDQAGTMSDEMAAVQWFTAKMNEILPDAKKVFIFGNHDHRYKNFVANKTDGIEEWVRTPEEMFGLGSDWEVIPYGQGRYYQWHDRIFWHGQRAGAKSDIAKLEVQDAGVSVTTAHINRNMYHEERDALGKLKSGITHGGFSRDNLHFVKKANSSWSQGFGIYYWDKQVGEQPYSVIMKHGNPRFISPDGEIFDGTGYNLREEIGLEVKRGRGRPRKGV